MTDGIAIEDAIAHYLERKAVETSSGGGSGAYATKAESILGRWNGWLVRERDVESISTVEIDDLRSYAVELCARTERGEYTASTAHTYFAVVRAFLSWCTDAGLVERNPAATDRAREPLPPNAATNPSETGAASPGWVRRKLVGHVRERTLAVDESDHDDRLDRMREHALVSLLANSDVRGSELFRLPADERRTGATWEDVDFYTGTIRVLGKSQRTEVVHLPAAARTPLRRYRVLQDPTTTDWPLFPTRHAPSIAGRVRSALRARGIDEREVEALLSDSTAETVARERAIAPPAITTEGARSILRRLCSDAGLDVESHLTPRGVRRPEATGGRRAGDSVPETDLLSPSSDRSIALFETYGRPFGDRPVESIVDE